ncbi:MAG: protease modulator HflK, partial [Aggregatibacter aphrophilus]|nr:protease modulator HflK [Aggregatibacter aphrophilus]
PKVMLDSSNGNNLTVLPLEQLLKGKQSSSTESNNTGSEAQQSAVNPAPVSRTENRTNMPTRQPETKNESSRQGRFN